MQRAANWLLWTGFAVSLLSFAAVIVADRWFYFVALGLNFIAIIGFVDGVASMVVGLTLKMKGVVSVRLLLVGAVMMFLGALSVVIEERFYDLVHDVLPGATHRKLLLYVVWVLVCACGVGAFVVGVTLAVKDWLCAARGKSFDRTSTLPVYRG